MCLNLREIYPVTILIIYSFQTMDLILFLYSILFLNSSTRFLYQIILQESLQINKEGLLLCVIVPTTVFRYFDISYLEFVHFFSNLLQFVILELLSPIYSLPLRNFLFLFLKFLNSVFLNVCVTFYVTCGSIDLLVVQWKFNRYTLLDKLTTEISSYYLDHRLYRTKSRLPRRPD